MINFHKFGFLDAKKLHRYTSGKNYWHTSYNPIWLFIWSDYYKPEIAYDNDFCYIRFLMPNIGICYYPPLGDKDISIGLDNIKKDCRECGFDLNIAPVSEDLFLKLNKLNYKLKYNDVMVNYIFNNEALAFQKGIKFKKSLAKSFERDHMNAFYKVIKKEDFPAILEFVEIWRRENETVADASYFQKLNAIKMMMDHLYEFDLNGIMLMDEERIYGIAIGSVMDNVSFLHLNLALNNYPGAFEELIICYSKNALLRTRYLNISDELNLISILGVKPVKKEGFYATFRL